jgi:WD repeat-containing protein 19
LVLDKKSLYLFNLKDPENPIELAFQPKYGNIVAYDWYGEGNLMLGFSSGYFISVSTHMDRIGQVRLALLST